SVTAPAPMFVICKACSVVGPAPIGWFPNGSAVELVVSVLLVASPDTVIVAVPFGPASSVVTSTDADLRPVVVGSNSTLTSQLWPSTRTTALEQSFSHPVSTVKSAPSDPLLVTAS